MGLKVSQLPVYIPWIVSSNANMMDLTPVIRVCHRAQLTLRKGDYLGWLDWITWALEIWILRSETGKSEIEIRGGFAAWEILHCWLEDGGGHMAKNSGRPCGQKWFLGVAIKAVRTSVLEHQKLNFANSKNKLRSGYLPRASGQILNVANTPIASLWHPEQVPQPCRAGLRTYKTVSWSMLFKAISGILLCSERELVQVHIKITVQL